MVVLVRRARQWEVRRVTSRAAGHAVNAQMGQWGGSSTLAVARSNAITNAMAASILRFDLPFESRYPLSVWRGTAERSWSVSPGDPS